MSNNYEEKISFLKKQYKEELSHIKNNEESFNCRWQTTWSFDEHFLGLACFLNIKWWIEYEYKHDILPSVENFPSDDFVRQKIFKKFTFSNLNNMWKLYENFRKY